MTDGEDGADPADSAGTPRSPGRPHGTPWYGVLVVMSALVVYIPVAGFANSFGVFVEMFDRDFCRRPYHCLDLLGLVSALALANFRLLCWLSVLLETLIPVSFVFLLGTALCVVSMLATSYARSIYVLLATHSLLFGFGSTFMINAPLRSIEFYFPRSHRFHVLATGIINLGPSIGVVIMNPLSVYLDSHERYSWRDTLQIFGVAIFLFASLHLAITAKQHLCPDTAVYEELDDVGLGDDPHNTTGNSSPWHPKTWLTLATGSWIIAILCIGWAIYIPKTMFMQYMTDQGISKEDGALLLSYSGVSETVFSVIISLTGDLMGAHIMVTYIVSAALLAVANGFLPFLSGQLPLGIYLVLHGACDGLLLTVLYGVVTSLIPCRRAQNPVWGLTNLAIGLGQVTGLPVAGFIYDQTGSYHLMFVMTCVVYCGSTALFVVTYIYSLRTSFCGYKVPDDGQVDTDYLQTTSTELPD